MSNDDRDATVWRPEREQLSQRDEKQQHHQAGDDLWHYQWQARQASKQATQPKRSKATHCKGQQRAKHNRQAGGDHGEQQAKHEAAAQTVIVPHLPVPFQGKPCPNGGAA